jgi:hypothetical protein
MGRAPDRRSRKKGLTLDFVLPTAVALLAMACIVGVDWALAVEYSERVEEGWYDDPTPPVKTLVEVQTLGIDGWTDEGATSDQDLGALPVNSTKIRAELTWQDDHGSNDVLRLTIINNDTEAISTEGSGGSLELEYSEGEEVIMEGGYGVQVTAVSCPGRVGVGPVDLDTGNDWTLRVHVTVIVVEV